MYPFPELKEVLEDTYGVYVYQEQVMKSSQILGGFTLGQADILRKAISKKKNDLIEEWIGYMIYGNQELNIEGAIARGFDEQKLLKLKEDWLSFANYAFNRSHASCYAMLSCITAYFKCYHPVEFMAALLTISEGKKDSKGNPKSLAYMKECERMGVRILPPDINMSNASWTPKTYERPIVFDEETYVGEIRYGLASIAGVSEESVKEIVGHRPYTSLENFLLEVNGTKVNKKKVEALIKSGAFDGFSQNRNALLRQYFQLRKEPYDHIPTQTSRQSILSFEKEVFGTAISVRSRFDKVAEGATTQVTGFIQSLEAWEAKSGKTHYRLVLSTNEEPITVLLWGYLYERYQPSVQIGNKVTIKGEKSRDQLTGSTVQLLINMYDQPPSE